MDGRMGFPNSTLDVVNDMKPKKINCKWCGMGHAPRSDGNHWIVKSIIPAKITIMECAYHKAGECSRSFDRRHCFSK